MNANSRGRLDVRPHNRRLPEARLQPERRHGGLIRSGSVSGIQVVVFLAAAAVAMLGLVFLIAAGQGNAIVRLMIAAVCWLAAGALIYLARMQPVKHTHIHKMELDLPGETNFQRIKCEQCGAALGSDAVKVQAGAVFVHCPYCGASYQLEEAPKW